MVKNKKGECQCIRCMVKAEPVSSLEDQEVKLLCDNSVNIEFKAGEKIIKQGAFTTNIVFIKSGLVKIHLTGPLKREEILKIEKGPTFAGIPSVFADRVHKYSVTALEDIDACFIDLNTFKNFIEKNGKFATEIIVTLSNDIISHFKRCVNKTQNQLTACFSEALIYFADYVFEKDEFQLPLTRSEFGAFIGTTRETVTRMFHDFAQDKIIEVKTKTIKILNKEILYKISNTCTDTA